MKHPHDAAQPAPSPYDIVELVCDSCGIPHVHVGDLAQLFSIPRLISYLEALQLAIIHQDVDGVPDEDRAAIAKYLLERHDEIQKVIDTLRALDTAANR